MWQFGAYSIHVTANGFLPKTKDVEVTLRRRSPLPLSDPEMLAAKGGLPQDSWRSRGCLEKSRGIHGTVLFVADNSRFDPIQTLIQLEELTMCADLVMRVALSLERQPEPFCQDSSVELRVKDVVTLATISGSAVIVYFEVIFVRLIVP